MNLVNDFYSDCLLQKSVPLSNDRLKPIIIAHDKLTKSDQIKLRLEILMKWGTLSGVKAQATGMIKGGLLLPFLDSCINEMTGLRLIILIVIGSTAGLLAARRTHPFFNTAEYQPRKALVNLITVKLSRSLDWSIRSINFSNDNPTAFRLTSN